MLSSKQELLLKEALRVQSRQINGAVNQSIKTLEGLFGLEKKNFKLPNMDCSKGYKARCAQFVSLLELFEEHIIMLKLNLE